MTGEQGAWFLKMRCLVQGCMQAMKCTEKEALSHIQELPNGLSMDKLEWGYLGLKWTEQNDPETYKAFVGSGNKILEMIACEL